MVVCRGVLDFKYHRDRRVEPFHFVAVKVRSRVECHTVHAGCKPGMFRKKVADSSICVRGPRRDRLPGGIMFMEFQHYMQTTRGSATGSVEDMSCDRALHTIDSKKKRQTTLCS